MSERNSSIAKRIAEATLAFERRANGRDPRVIIVSICDGGLVVAMSAALTPAERVSSLEANGAARIQEFHQQLFVSASGNLRKRIERISGIPLGVATARVEADTGILVEGLATGNELDVFMLTGTADP